MDPASSITIGVTGNKTSFWTALCDEFCRQDEAVFQDTIQAIVIIIGHFESRTLASHTIHKTNSYPDASSSALVHST
jgi:hypothetical protein